MLSTMSMIVVGFPWSSVGLNIDNTSISIQTLFISNFNINLRFQYRFLPFSAGKQPQTRWSSYHNFHVNKELLSGLIATDRQFFPIDSSTFKIRDITPCKTQNNLLLSVVFSMEGIFSFTKICVIAKYLPLEACLPELESWEPQSRVSFWLTIISNITQFLKIIIYKDQTLEIGLLKIVLRLMMNFHFLRFSGSWEPHWVGKG